MQLESVLFTHKKLSLGAVAENATELLRRLLLESERWEHAAVFPSNGYAQQEGRYELLFAFGSGELLGRSVLEQGALNQGWLFGYLGYELRLAFENVEHRNAPIGHWDDASFFVPEVVGVLHFDGQLDLHAPSLEAVDAFVEAFQEWDTKAAEFPTPELHFTAVESPSEYLEAVRALKGHIQRGDIYEVNYCTAFTAVLPEQSDVRGLWLGFIEKTQAPFSAWLQLGARQVLSVSPERYLKREGARLCSQPIKGTNRALTGERNETQQAALRTNVKERAENVMIVDLVRNDLSRVAQRGSVQVSELCGVYAFKNVNQMISTVECSLREGTSNWDVVRATFPMGSMTGAPKVSAMNLADRFEKTARGVYSGAIGYVEPNGDFDFNVVIRSLAIDREANAVTCHVGSAITALSQEEEEYKECLLKAESLLGVMNDMAHARKKS